ncbi:hypothetical protein ACFSNB_17135, partial [Phaeospirillum tilakii]
LAAEPLPAGRPEPRSRYRDRDERGRGRRRGRIDELGIGEMLHADDVIGFGDHVPDFILIQIPLPTRTTSRDEDEAEDEGEVEIEPAVEAAGDAVEADAPTA